MDKKTKRDIRICGVPFTIPEEPPLTNEIVAQHLNALWQHINMIEAVLAEHGVELPTNPDAASDALVRRIRAHAVTDWQHINMIEAVLAEYGVKLPTNPDAASALVRRILAHAVTDPPRLW